MLEKKGKGINSYKAECMIASTLFLNGEQPLPLHRIDAYGLYFFIALFK
jgi:hypothetical protein